MAEAREAPRPYLPAVGAPPLRFMEATPPPDLVSRPPAAGDPPGLHASVRQDTEDQPSSDSMDGNVDVTVAGALPTTALAAAPASANEKIENAPGKVGPAPILPDDTRPAVRPEDFLPFFQMPGTSTRGEATVIIPVPRQAPAPAALPPSSATYRQTP